MPDGVPDPDCRPCPELCPGTDVETHARASSRRRCPCFLRKLFPPDLLLSSLLTVSRMIPGQALGSLSADASSQTYKPERPVSSIPIPLPNPKKPAESHRLYVRLSKIEISSKGGQSARGLPEKREKRFKRRKRPRKRRRLRRRAVRGLCLEDKCIRAGWTGMGGRVGWLVI